MRGLFIGISVPLDRAVECLASAQELWKCHNYLTWFPPESLHCTLAYVQPLGDQPDIIDRTKRTMIDTMKQIGASAYRFGGCVNHFEWFDPAKKTLVLTNRPGASGTLRLAKLAERLMHDLRQRHLDVRQSQPFRAHVSLGERNVEVVRANSPIYYVPPSQPLKLTFDIWQLKLFQSVGGHCYELLHTTPLLRSGH